MSWSSPKTGLRVVGFGHLSLVFLFLHFLAISHRDQKATILVYPKIDMVTNFLNLEKILVLRTPVFLDSNFRVNV